MKTKYIINIAVMLVAMSSIRAQQVIGGLLNENLYNTRVKLVDEFFERFNGKAFRPDINASAEDANMKNLLLLFNGKMFKSFQDSAFIEAKTFAQKVIHDSIHISYRDSTWIARARCHGTFKGTPVDFTLYLNTENRRENLYKWVIAKAEGDIFSLSPSQSKETIMLMPDDHETNFMSLHRITTEKDDYILNYGQKGCAVDPTSVFYAYVYAGILDIEYVDQLDFMFFQVQGYKFTISHFERENFNAGWLISSLDKITEEDKWQFLKYIYKK